MSSSYCRHVQGYQLQHIELTETGLVIVLTRIPSVPPPARPVRVVETTATVVRLDDRRRAA